MSDLKSTILGITLCASFTVGMLIFLACAACSPVHVRQKTLLNQKEHSGIRSDCVPPPQHIDGVAKRFDESCTYEEGGLAICIYMTEAMFVKHWACGLAAVQQKCGAEWKVVEMKCVPWEENFRPLVSGGRAVDGEE
jgi:hypothetical protein